MPTPSTLPQDPPPLEVVRQPDLTGIEQDKRFYIPGALFRSACPKCHASAERDTTVCDDYLGYPVAGKVARIYFICAECDAEWSCSVGVDIRVVLTSPAEPSSGGCEIPDDAETVAEKGRVYRSALREAARRIGVARTDDDRDQGEDRGLDSTHAIVCRLIDESSAATEPAEPVPDKMLQYELGGQAQGWMTVGLGTRFNPLDPKPEDINVADIARALSRLPRYGGHGERTMSVAEHCVLLTWWVEKVASGADLDVPSGEMLAVLHHDDEEAYICDMPRPIKHGVPGLLAIYEALADKILDAIHAHLGIERWEKTAIYDLAKDLDHRVVFAELPALFATDPGWQPGSAEGYEPECWTAEEAERRFLAAHEAWGGTVPASPERAGS